MRSKAVERREQALEEIAQTRLSRRWVGAVLVAGLVATIALVPTVQLIVEFRSNPDTLPHPLTVFRLLPRPGEIAQAHGVFGWLELFPSLKEIHDFETRLEETSVVANWLLPRVQYVLTAFLGVGNEQAYLGEEGWLFYRPDVDALIGRGFLDPRQQKARIQKAAGWEDPPHPDPVAAIVSFSEQLGARGVALVVLPTPVKPSIYPDRLTRRLSPPREPVQNPSYETFLAALRKHGVRVFDPAPLLLDDRRSGRPTYLRTDTHWTPAAMERVAERLADYLVAERLVSPGPDGRYRRAEKAVTHLGDIATMLKLPPGRSPVRAETVEVHPVFDATGRPWEPDPNAPVLLLGDSFTNIYSLVGMGWGDHAGLAEQLSVALQRPVDRIARNAGGAFATREALRQALLRGEDPLAGKRVVVYQFATRELALGDWKPVTLPMPRRLATPSSSARPAAPVVVEGTIRARTLPPSPGDVPYPDAIVALHLVQVRATSGTFPDSEALVFTWGMRRRTWTPITARGPGERVRFRLVPWETVEDRYGSFVRVELYDEAAWLLNPYWGEPMP